MFASKSLDNLTMSIFARKTWTVQVLLANIDMVRLSRYLLANVDCSGFACLVYSLLEVVRFFNIHIHLFLCRAP